jgi:hypothetical protein
VLRKGTKPFSFKHEGCRLPFSDNLIWSVKHGFSPAKGNRKTDCTKWQRDLKHNLGFVFVFFLVLFLLKKKKSTLLKYECSSKSQVKYCRSLNNQGCFSTWYSLIGATVIQTLLFFFFFFWLFGRWKISNKIKSYKEETFGSRPKWVTNKRIIYLS